MSELNSMVGEKMRQLRMQKNMTQKELGEKLSMTQQNVSKFENAEVSFSIDIIAKMSEYFQVSSDYFLEIDGICEEKDEDALLYWFRSAVPEDKALILKIAEDIVNNRKKHVEHKK